MRRAKFLGVLSLAGALMGLQAWLQPVPRNGAPGLLRSLGVVLLLLGASLGLGRALALRLGVYFSSLFEEAAVSLGLGLAALSALGFGLGAAGVLYPWLAWLLLAALLLSQLGHLEHFAAFLRRNLKLKRPWDGSSTEVALLLATAWTWLAMLALALAPVSFYDALVYHLASPQRAALSGLFRPQEAVLFSWLPGGAEQLWALALALDQGAPLAGPNAASLLNLAAAAILVLAVTDLSARLASTQRQWTGPALLLAQPLVALAFAVFSADGWACLYAALSLAAFLNAAGDKLDRARGGWLALAFLFAGVAASMKPVAGLHGAALILLTLLAALKEPSWRRPRVLAACMAAMLAPLLPWMLRGWMLKADPIYPFGLELLGYRIFSGAAPAYFEHLAGFGAQASGPLAFWRLPFALSFEPGLLGGGGHLLALFLALAPAAALVKHPREARWLGLYAALSLPLWALGPRVLRYFLPFVPALAVYAAFLLAALEPLAKSRGWALALRGLLCAACFLGAVQTWSVVAKDFDPLRAALGLEVPESYLARMGVQGARAGAWLRARVGVRAKGLLLGDSRAAGLPSGAVAASAFEEHPAAAWLGQVRSAEELGAKLRQKGYDFVLVNRAEWARVAAIPGSQYGYLGPPGAREAFDDWLVAARGRGPEKALEDGAVLAVILR